MEVGSLVEVSLGGRQLYGVVRWCGKPRGKPEHCLVGVELVAYLDQHIIETVLIMTYLQENEIEEGSDGSYLGQSLFRCAPGRGVYVPLRHCRPDSRFASFCDVTKPSAAGRHYDFPPDSGIVTTYYDIKENF